MSAINLSRSVLETAQRYSDPTNIISSVTESVASPIKRLLTTPIIGGRNPPSTIPGIPLASMVKFAGSVNPRVRLRVPESYLVGIAAGPNYELTSMFGTHGILFPYTPSINVEHTANYGAINTIHSNYTQYFYKNSQVGEISLTAKFTVQNEKEAAIYLSIIHLLRALIKMRFGDDDNAGSPPPVCRLDAYGEYVMSNVPVAIKNFRTELPDNVDYFTTGKLYPNYGSSSVPVLSTITLGLIPLYSRNEMLKGTVNGWLTGHQRSQGYL